MMSAAMRRTHVIFGVIAMRLRGEDVIMHWHPSHHARSRVAIGFCVFCMGWIASSCGSDQMLIGSCTAVASEAVEITVRDSVSGAARADGARGTLMSSSVSDTLVQLDSLRLRGGDQLGTYMVTVDRPGYLAWTASNVRVTEEGACGNVIPVQLNARLQPATP
jgi:hypothetical protein